MAIHPTGNPCVENPDGYSQGVYTVRLFTKLHRLTMRLADMHDRSHTLRFEV